jgi:hypothetical protein
MRQNFRGRGYLGCGLCSVLYVPLGVGAAKYFHHEGSNSIESDSQMIFDCLIGLLVEDIMPYQYANCRRGTALSLPYLYSDANPTYATIV